VCPRSIRYGKKPLLKALAGLVQPAHGHVICLQASGHADRDMDRKHLRSRRRCLLRASR
jgi:hypothetical protein